MFCGFNGLSRLTNERLYESNDSLEIENGSISAKLRVVLEDAFDGLERRGQKLFFSGGDGYHNSQSCSTHPGFDICLLVNIPRYH